MQKMEKMEKIYNNTVSVIFNNDLYTNLDKYEYDRVYEEFYNNVYNNMDIWKNYVNEQYNELYHIVCANISINLKELHILTKNFLFDANKIFVEFDMVINNNFSIICIAFLFFNTIILAIICVLLMQLNYMQSYSTYTICRTLQTNALYKLKKEETVYEKVPISEKHTKTETETETETETPVFEKSLVETNSPTETSTETNDNDIMLLNLLTSNNNINADADADDADDADETKSVNSEMTDITMFSNQLRNKNIIYCNHQNITKKGYCKKQGSEKYAGYCHTHYMYYLKHIDDERFKDEYKRKTNNIKMYITTEK